MPERRTIAQSVEHASALRDAFLEFSELELNTGGPDHHLYTIGRLARELYPYDKRSRAFLVGCYLAPYNVPGGLVVDAGRPDSFSSRWWETNWDGIPIRKECRPRRSARKMAEFMASYMVWVDSSLSRILDGPGPTYDELWDSLSEVRYVGRYSGMKLLEALRRSGVHSCLQPDIRAHGAWSPRLALSYLYPEHDEILNRDSSRLADQFAEDLARDFYETEDGVILPNMYTLEVLLCVFKQAMDGHYYPGRPLDSELDQLRQVREFFDQGLDAQRVEQLVLTSRSRIFASRFLGEVSGWDGKRKELGRCYLDHGYFWSDLRYNWNLTDDLAEPVERYLR